MKRITPTQARRNWFRLLDEVAEGQVVLIERKGQRIVLRREEPPPGETPSDIDYRRLLQVPDLDDADRWGWECAGSGSEMVLRERPEEEPEEPAE